MEILKTENNKKDQKNSIEVKIIGWAGTVLIITAYSLNSLQYLPTNNVIYPLLNIMGGLLMGYRVFKDKNWSNVFLEVFWVGVAVISLVKIVSLL